MSLRRRAPSIMLALSLLGGVTLAACHLFLDPDDLTAGNGTDGGGASEASSGTSGTSGGTSGTSGGTSGATSSGSLDASDKAPEWIGQVPSCVPKNPVGTQVFAVVGALPGQVPACPAGYEATGQTGFTAILDTKLECTTGSCACGAYTGSTSSFGCNNARMTYYADPACKTPLDSDSLEDFSCPKIGSTNVTATHARVTGSIRANGGGGGPGGSNTCPPTGEPTETKQQARVGLEVHVCKATAAATNPGCNGSDVPAVPVKGAVACYQSTSANCEPGYSGQFTFAQTADLTDTRKCECRCAIRSDGGTCSGGTIRPNAYSPGFGCIGGDAAIPGTCRPIAEYGPLARLTDDPVPDPASFRCTPEATKEGNVSFTSPQQLLLCCMTRCQACRQAVSAPGAICALQVKACLDDVKCKEYFNCAQTKRCTGELCSGCGDPTVVDGGPGPPQPSAQTATLYKALRTCQTNACPPPECDGPNDP